MAGEQLLGLQGTFHPVSHPLHHHRDVLRPPNRPHHHPSAWRKEHTERIHRVAISNMSCRMIETCVEVQWLVKAVHHRLVLDPDREPRMETYQNQSFPSWRSWNEHRWVHKTLQMKRSSGASHLGDGTSGKAMTTQHWIQRFRFHVGLTSGLKRVGLESGSLREIGVVSH